MRLLLILIGAIIFLQNAHGHYFKRFKTLRRPVPQNAGNPLILTPLLEAGQIEEARRQAKVNYSDFKNIDFYSGYYQVDKQFDNNLFFYFFPSEGNYEEDPVVLWLQGGPGSPAGFGLFEENGPFILNQDYSISLREYRWTKNQSVLYIDSPVGTGFSYTARQGYAQNQTRVGKDLYEGLIQFFTMFPELQKNDFFVVGESYGGKYVPAVGYTILKNNPTAPLKIPLKGLATGNGLSDPVNQGNYGDYLYQLGFVDAKTRDKFHEYEALVEKYVLQENWSKASEVFSDDMNSLISDATGVDSEYNYLQLDPDAESNWQAFLQKQLRDPLHIGNTPFNGGPVYDYLFDDIAKSVAPWISELLGNYRFLIYNGQLDIICAYPMMANFLQKLNFSASVEYKSAVRQIWQDAQGIAGYYKVAGNLTELLVRNAGHMVPSDQPKRAYMMIYAFVRGMSFSEDL